MTGLLPDDVHDDCVTVTVNVAVVATLILCVVAPVDHKYELELLADKFTVCPVQILVGPLAVITAVGVGLMVTTVPDDTAVQPEALLTVTV